MDPDARSKRQQPSRPSRRRPSRWIGDSDHHEPPSPKQLHFTPLRPNPGGPSSVLVPATTDRLIESRPGPSVLVPPNSTTAWPGVFDPSSSSSSSLGRSYKRVDSHPTAASVPGHLNPPSSHPPSSRDDPVVVKLEPTSGIETLLDAPTSTVIRQPPTGLLGWSDHPPLPPLTATPASYPSPQTYDPRYPFDPRSNHRPPPSQTPIMPTGSASSSRLGVNNPGRGRRRSGHSNAIIDIDPIILRERERMENERMQRENVASATSATTTTTGPPAHYSHQILTAAGPSRRPVSPPPREPLGLLASSSFVPPPLQTFPFPRDSTRRSSPALDGDTRRRTSSLTTNPFNSLPLQQHHRLPTTSAAPIASAISNSTSSGGPLVGPSSSHTNYPPGSQPSVMALPPGSAARIADGPSGSGSGGIPPPGTVLITSGGPSVAGHHPHQVQGGMHPAHDNGGHDKMNMLLGEIRSEYEVLQTDCMVLKGQRDEYENKSECSGSGFERGRLGARAESW
jgi:hypothetical protein